MTMKILLCEGPADGKVYEVNYSASSRFSVPIFKEPWTSAKGGAKIETMHTIANYVRDDTVKDTAHPDAVCFYYEGDEG